MKVCVVENSSKTKDNYFKYNSQEDLLYMSRDVYLRLQNHIVDYDINLNDIFFSFFCEEMQKIQDGNSSNESASKLDDFLGSLGVSQIYPHKDNTYGELNG
jgi:hypothetical protein